MVNLHFSLLPRWRGAAPVERALLAGDVETGVCLMAARGGPRHRRRLRACATVPIGPADDGRRAARRAGRRRHATARRRLGDGLGDAEPQVGEPTYAAKIEPEELRIDWSRPAGELDRLVRLGGAWTTFRGQRLKVRRRRALVGDDAVGDVLDGDRVGGLRLARRCSPRARRRWPSGRLRPRRPRRRPASGSVTMTARAGRLPQRCCASTTTAPTPTSCCAARSDASRPRPRATGLRHRAGLRHDPHAPGLRRARRPLRRQRAGARACARCCASAPTSSPSPACAAHAAVGETVDAGARSATRLRQRRAPPRGVDADGRGRRRDAAELPGLDRRPARRRARRRRCARRAGAR